MLLALLTSLALAGPAAAEPTCHTAYGQTACGWDCTAAYGQLQCAQVPWGACEAAYGQVVCGPAPDGTPLRAADRIPQATCKAAFGQIACGWDCTAAYGTVACASSPWGACRAAFGTVTCSDDGTVLQPIVTGDRASACVTVDGVLVCPDGAGAAPVVVPGRPRPGGAAPAVQATCESAFGQTACGYDCVAAFGQVRCARTPRGTCTAAHGTITCWDPPGG